MQVWQELINQRGVYLVVGASQDRTKWGYRVWKHLRLSGYQAVPVNPKYTEIDGERCYPSIGDMIYDLRFKNKIENIVVVTVVPPAVTEKVVEECGKLGINKIWMQPGSEFFGSAQDKLQIVRGKCIVRDGLGKPFVV